MLTHLLDPVHVWNSAISQPEITNNAPAVLRPDVNNKQNNRQLYHPIIIIDTQLNVLTGLFRSGLSVSPTIS